MVGTFGKPERVTGTSSALYRTAPPALEEATQNKETLKIYEAGLPEESMSI